MQALGHKLVAGCTLRRFVWHHLVKFLWSPEQIAATLRSMHPDDPQARVSHETIYAMIYAQPRGGRDRRRWWRPCASTSTGAVSVGASGASRAAALEGFTRQMVRQDRGPSGAA